jgi:chemotaxis protein CheC
MTQKAAALPIDQQGAEPLVGVRQCFQGSLTGCALLILPEAKGKALTRAVLGDDLLAQEVVEMEEETLTETGNVILNGCLGTIANMLQHSLAMSLPELLRGDGSALFEVTEYGSKDGCVLYLYANVSIRTRDVRGYIALVMDLPSMTVLKALLGEFIEWALGQDA